MSYRNPPAPAAGRGGVVAESGRAGSSGGSGVGRRRPARLPLLFLLPVLAGACASAPRSPAPVPGARTLAAVVDSIRSTPPLDRTHWGIEVYDPAARRVLYSLNPALHFVPASNTKLVVTAVALGELGPEHRYRTELYALMPRGGAVEGGEAAIGEVDGLLLLARGDPTLSRRFHPEGPTPLAALADSVAAAGVRRVRGDLVVDLTYFDDQPIHPAWEVGDLTYQYAAPVAAFAVEEGTFRVVVAPGDSVGAPARVSPLAPPGAVEVVAAVGTAAAEGRGRVAARRRYLSDVVELHGTIPLGAPPDTLRVAAPYPAELAARELLAELAARGIEVAGEVRLITSPAESARLRGTAADTGTARVDDTGRGDDVALRLIATWHSPPLTEIVAAILKPSQNWIAEQLLKTLGAERGERGSWREGIAVETRYLIDVVGLDSAEFRLADGSGLAAQNLLTPRAIVRLLDHARQQPWGPHFRDALARPGESGTLEHRLTEFEGRLFAKTGTITYVNSLSGYLHTPDGRELIFSIMTNASGTPAATVRRAIDRIVRAIAPIN